MNNIDEATWNEKLIATVKQYPVLYNHRLREYHDRVLQDSIWAKILLQMHDGEVEQGNEESVNELKRRWQNLRSSFRRAVHLGNNPPRTIHGLKRKRRNDWYLKDHMLFLLPYVKLGTSTKGMLSYSPDTQDQQGSENGYDDDDDGYDYHQPDIEPEIKLECLLDDSGSKFDESPNSSSQELPSLPSEHKIISPWLKTELAETPPPTFDDNLVNDNGVTSQTVDSELGDDDTDMIFWKSISPDVKQLNPPNKRKFKLLVMTHLNELLEQQPCGNEPKL